MNKNINIRGRKYSIQVTNIIDDEIKYAGLCDSINKIIYIKPGETIEETLNTLIHELTHAFLFESGLKQQAKDETINDYIEAQFLFFLNSFLDGIKIIFPQKKYEADKIKEFINNIFEMNFKDIN